MRRRSRRASRAPRDEVLAHDFASGRMPHPLADDPVQDTHITMMGRLQPNQQGIRENSRRSRAAATRLTQYRRETAEVAEDAVLSIIHGCELTTLAWPRFSGRLAHA